MKAIILAAGYATRMYPLTENFPKSLLAIAGKPIVEYTIEKIRACSEIDLIYIVTNSKFFITFQKWLQSFNAQQDSISFQPIALIDDGTHSNEQRIGTVADLWYVVEKTEIDDDLLVLCSDKMFEFTLVEFVNAFHKKKETMNTVHDIRDMEQIRYKRGCVVVDGNGRIMDFEEKPSNPKSTLESVAFYLFPRHVLPRIKQYLSEGGNPDAPGFFLQWLTSKEHVYAHFFNENCYDVGNLENYREVQRIYKRITL